MTDPVLTAGTSAFPAKPPRKARKPRAPKPSAAPPKERKKPDTIHAWIRAQGSSHVEAARILGKQFVRDLRDEQDRGAKKVDATLRVARLKNELAAAENVLAAIDTTGCPHQARLDALAKTIADARGDSGFRVTSASPGVTVTVTE